MATEKLDLEERLKVLRTQQGAYHRASRTEKGRILDALESITQLDRKTIIRVWAAAATGNDARRGGVAAMVPK